METAATTQATTIEPADEKRYRFDEQEIYISINARPEAAKPAYVVHKLRKPVFEELNEWTKALAWESVEVSKRESEFKSDDTEAHVRLWNKIILAIKGNFGDGQPVGEFRPLTEEQKGRVKTEHKVAAVRGLYLSDCEVDYGEEDEASEPLIFGGEQWRIKQTISNGKYTVVHILREPTEAERLKFKRNSNSTLYVTGSRKQRSKSRTNLKAYTELYDSLIVDVEGATVEGKEMNYFARDAVGKWRFTQQIDSVFKQLVIQKLMGALDADLQD